FWKRSGITGRAFAAVVVIILIIGGLAVYRSKKLSANVAATPSIAVIPFANLGEEKNEFFSDGLTDELIDSLGHVQGLRVVGRNTSFEVKGKTGDVVKIGRELSVRAVLEGSVRQSGNRVRITAELDDTSTGYRLWSRSYDRDLKDVIAVQMEISTAIANAL